MVNDAVSAAVVVQCLSNNGDKDKKFILICQIF